MFENSQDVYKNAGLYVEQTELAADSRNYRGVLVREALPPFSIHLDDGTKIEVSPFPYYKLKQAEKQKWFVIKDFIQMQPTCPKNACLDFLYSPMLRFLHEYECLRQNGMFNFVRATANKQFSFHFYQTEYEAENQDSKPDKKKQKNTRGGYDVKSKTINFNCSNYYLSEDRSNVLAHEMCHCVMDNVNANPCLSTLVLSDIGTTWCQFIKSAIFLGDVRWRKFDEKKLKQINNFKTDFMKMFRELNDSWQVILTYDSIFRESTCFSELFAYMLGGLCADKKKINLYEENCGENVGIRFVCDLANAISNNDTIKQKCILQTVQNHKVSTALKGSLITLKDLQIDVLSASSYTSDEYVELAYAFAGCCYHFEKEYKEIQKKINRMYCKEKGNEHFEEQEKMISNLQTVLITSSDRSDKRANRELFHQIVGSIRQYE